VNATASFGAELIEPCRQRLRDIWHQALQHGQERPRLRAARVTVKLQPITRRERNIPLSLVLLVGIAYLAGRLAIP
jgi:hypothetical protein